MKRRRPWQGPCLRLGCEAPATRLVVPVYGRPWRGCDVHAPAMAEALSIGQAQAAQPRTEKLS